MTVLNFDLANFSRAVTHDPESAIALEAWLQAQHTAIDCNSLCCTPQMPAEKLYTCDRCTMLKTKEETEEETEDETIECYCCSDRVDPEEIYTVNSDDSEQSVCSDCFNTEYKMCVLDGEYYENDEITLSGRFKAYHITEEQRDRAGVSDRYQDIRININPSTAYDFQECNDCNLYFPDDCMNETSDHEYVCGRCSQRNYFSCCNCNNLFHNDNYGSDGCCENCEPDDKPESCEYIKSYSFDVLDVLPFLGKASDKIFLGIELETISEEGELHDNAESISEVISGYGILKEDGSLDDEGFEIVTAPASLGVHLEKLSYLIDNKGDLDVDSRCGLHIHISRSPLTDAEIGKMLVFVNHPDNLEFIEFIAGRSNSMYSEISKKKITDSKKWCKRYSAINLQNDDTIEVRLFQATFDKLELLARVEFVHAMVYFCFQSSQIDSKLHYTEFLAWLDKPEQKYKNLKKLIKGFWN